MAELSTIARPYAGALFALVKQDSASYSAWSATLSELAQVVSVSDVREAISDPNLSKAQRAEILTGLVKSPLSDTARNFITVLAENDRLLVLPEVALQFEALKNEQNGVAEAHIASAFEMSDEQVKDLLAGLENKFGTKLKPVVTVDKSLIGGIRVTVGDQVLDTSVQAQLSRLRDTMVAV